MPNTTIGGRRWSSVTRRAGPAGPGRGRRLALTAVLVALAAPVAAQQVDIPDLSEEPGGGIRAPGAAAPSPPAPAPAPAPAPPRVAPRAAEPGQAIPAPTARPPQSAPEPRDRRAARTAQRRGLCRRDERVRRIFAFVDFDFDRKIDAGERRNLIVAMVDNLTARLERNGAPGLQPDELAAGGYPALAARLRDRAFPTREGRNPAFDDGVLLAEELRATLSVAMEDASPHRDGFLFPGEIDRALRLADARGYPGDPTWNRACRRRSGARP